MLQRYLNPLENIMKCIEMNWMCILNGPTASGKTTLVRLIAQLTRNTLYEFAMNTSVDTMELLGSFEQMDMIRYKRRILQNISNLIQFVAERLLQVKDKAAALHTIQQLQNNWSLLSIRTQHTKQQQQPSNLVFDEEEYQIIALVLSQLDKECSQCMSLHSLECVLTVEVQMASGCHSNSQLPHCSTKSPNSRVSVCMQSPVALNG
jgi:midasin